ncbi:hypothetical protein ACDI89_25520 (plasmid) [Mycobacteroides abscessus]|uniref:hypothetical protein n=1 Tax=Mycobacteroides abscessus TaxID=36809 RepID=UPI0009C911A7|nr:hypothetical protein [Mycobacteroides abscessus]MBE5408322.1 hypothetical protein [Mycobacteroides abscessus]MBN7468767.1 hypothetical protein [Mycobacteroides abscessus subsp. massiliense]MDM2402518.1 hypothetical protein [Mycobacteroides abscessus]MDM2412810.1 hypothetical protein [Mycobacteroides abscessus]SLC57013.1 Uncharacterised protein [Mycobacteroides abscessus subsp. massiliense]
MTDTPVTERDMLDLLLSRYTAIRQFTIADRWVRAEHVASDLGHRQTGITKVADFIAADKYPGWPYGSALAFHGHEVKVSRSDWLSELRDPNKSEVWRRYMHYWWLVVSDKSIVREGELPDGWGLMVKAGSVLRAQVKAPRLSPDPLPADRTIALMAAAARTAHREPLRRDAPKGGRSGEWTVLCGFCGQASPCSTHQPRAHESAQLKDQPA